MQPVIKKKFKSFNIFQSIRFLSNLINKKDKSRILFLLIGSLFVGIFEILSVYSISPVLNAIGSNSVEIGFLSGFLSSVNPKNLIFYGGICFTLLIAFTSFIKIKILAYGHFLGADIGQILGIVGPQDVWGERIKDGFDDRTLPHYHRYDIGPDDNNDLAGFCTDIVEPYGNTNGNLSLIKLLLVVLLFVLLLLFSL